MRTEVVFYRVWAPHDRAQYAIIKDRQIEDFIGQMMQQRQRSKPFELFKAEYRQVGLSLKRRESIHWKETLALLSLVLNYPAKYLSSEDTIRM